MNRYPRWLNLTVLIALSLATFFALPNIFGKAPAVQLARDKGQALATDMDAQVRGILEEAGAVYDDVIWDKDRLFVRFVTLEDQLVGKEALDKELRRPGSDINTALNLVPRMPDWLRALGVRPLHLGLDLRGGVHLLFEVDMVKALEQAREQYGSAFKALGRDNDIPGVQVRESGDAIAVTARNAADRDALEKHIRDLGEPFVIERQSASDGRALLKITLSPEQVRERQTFAIQQNTTTMRSRLNQLGVAEPVVQRQGVDRIVVQLPGVQDSTEVIGILSAVATLQFRGECENANAVEALRTSRAPPGCVLYTEGNLQGVGGALLRRDIIATGDQLTDARASFSQQDGPIVNVKLDSTAARRMLKFTQDNLNKRMGVVFIETETETDPDTGVRTTVTSERIISLATIRGVFGASFQISGLTQFEAQELSLLLRAGALAAPIYVVEERTVGPTLGQDNIDKGMMAVIMGFALVVVFMLFYYRVFGLIADFALFFNLVIIIGVLSLLQASLTLPGIAGIVLTVGMAVDANVLIFERIREELRNGNSPQAAIHAGYDKAFSSIADANVTTFIAAIVLWAFGTGPIKGFAITLCIGILSSMFTAIVGTRAVVNLLYGGRKLDTLPI